MWVGVALLSPTGDDGEQPAGPAIVGRQAEIGEDADLPGWTS
jgi:hypothetical protein